MGNSLRTKRDITIAIFGLDGAGKSTYIDNLNEDDIDDTPLPTVGYNTRRLTKGRYNIVLAEVGGGIHIRGVWPKYFAQSHALIYMVDGCSSIERIQETKDELHKVLLDERMKCKPLLVLCNKDDQPTCIEAQQLVTKLDLSKILQDSVDTSGLVTELKARVWLCTCLRPSGRQDPRLHKSLNWLLQKVTDQWSTLSVRVQEQHRIELEEKERERQERIAQRRRKIEEEERLEREAIRLAEEGGPSANETTSLPINTEEGAETVMVATPPPPLPPPQIAPLSSQDLITHPHPHSLPPLPSPHHSHTDTFTNFTPPLTHHHLHPSPKLLAPIKPLHRPSSQREGDSSSSNSISSNSQSSLAPPSSSSLTNKPSLPLQVTSTATTNGASNNNATATSTVRREESQDSVVSSSSSKRIVKTARIIRKLRSRNKLHPVDSDMVTTLSTNNSHTTTNSSNSNSNHSTLSSRPPLLSPWVSNSTSLPIEKAPSSFGGNRAAGSGSEVNDINVHVHVREGEQEEHVVRKEEGSPSTVMDGVNGSRGRKQFLAPITNHSVDMINTTFTLPQDAVLTPPVFGGKGERGEGEGEGGVVKGSPFVVKTIN